MRTVIALLIFFISLPSVTLAQTSKEQLCMIEAREAITQTSAYKNASVRQKQQMLHALNPKVMAKLKTCRES